MNKKRKRVNLVILVVNDVKVESYELLLWHKAKYNFIFFLQPYDYRYYPKVNKHRSHLILSIFTYFHLIIIILSQLKRQTL